MDRRAFFSAAPAAAVAAVAAPFIKEPGTDEPIRGVGVLRFPNKKGTKEIAQKLADHIRQGTIIAMPNTRDSYGEYEWDFRIEGGEVAQVRVERPEDTTA